MGLYIETGGNKGKADFIHTAMGGQRIPYPEEFMSELEDDVLVCVVDNGVFEAAGVAYDESEFQVFSQEDDSRPKQWLLVPRKNLLVYLVTNGYSEKELKSYGIMKESE